MSTSGISHKRRLVIMLWSIGAIFLVLLGRLFYLMVIQGEELQQMALAQWTRDTSLSAARGLIMDKSGTVLAQSGTAYKVLLWPNSIKSAEKERVAGELSRVLGMEYATVLERVNNTKLQQIELKRGVERSVVEEIATLQLGSGVGTAVDTKRYYPNGSLFSQLLGFTTIDGVGQAGLEQKYDTYLAGENGRTITETDRKGNALAYGAEEVVEPIDGYDLVLCADGAVQSFLEKALEEAVAVNKAENAQGIVMNCKTGEIIALSTKPDYDPNAPPRSDMELLNSLMRERVVTDAYEPGSTFKIVTLAAALDSGAVTPESSFNCGGSYHVNGERIRCWRSGGHGHQTLTEAVENSCNVAFMQMAQKLGEDAFYDYIYAFGFGSVSGCGIAGEASGIVTNQKYMTENTLVRMGFGQSIAMTPLQLAAAAGAAVNGGNLMQPYVLQRVVANDGTVILENDAAVVRRVIKGETSETVRKILESVVAEGSGKNAQVPGYRVGGKTGTAQKYEDGQIADGKLIASFLGFAPAEDPTYLVLILVDEPKVGVIFGSTVAAPFVADVLEDMLKYYGYMPESETVAVSVPDVTGQDVTDAKSALKAAGLDTTVQGTGEVIAQIPRAGTTAADGSNVLLYTADTDVEYATTDAPEDEIPEDTTTVVPDIFDMSRLAAAKALKKAGLTMVVPGEQKGKVIRQVPPANTTMEKGGTVLVEFSDATMGMKTKEEEDREE